MIDRFLKAKHWQIFLILLGIPIIFQVILMVMVFSRIDLESNSNPTVMFEFFYLFPLMMIIFSLVFFGWFWSMAIGLQEKIPNGIKMKVKKFKVFFFIPFIYINLLCIFMSISFLGIGNSGLFPNNYIEKFYLLIVPLHLFSMFCMFYILYFTSKTIKTVELQRKVSFADYIGEFFILWFYLIGIWFIQPKINKLALKKPETIEDIGLNNNNLD